MPIFKNVNLEKLLSDLNKKIIENFKEKKGNKIHLKPIREELKKIYNEDDSKDNDYHIIKLVSKYIKINKNVKDQIEKKDFSKREKFKKDVICLSETAHKVSMLLESNKIASFAEKIIKSYSPILLFSTDKIEVEKLRLTKEIYAELDQCKTESQEKQKFNELKSQNKYKNLKLTTRDSFNTVSSINYPFIEEVSNDDLNKFPDNLNEFSCLLDEVSEKMLAIKTGIDSKLNQQKSSNKNFSLLLTTLSEHATDLKSKNIDDAIKGCDGIIKLTKTSNWFGTVKTINKSFSNLKKELEKLKLQRK